VRLGFARQGGIYGVDGTKGMGRRLYRKADWFISDIYDPTNSDSISLEHVPLLLIPDHVWDSSAHVSSTDEMHMQSRVPLASIHNQDLV
jgi:hypothetical protein